MPIVTRAGFITGEQTVYRPLEDYATGEDGIAIELANDADPAPLAEHFARIASIRIPFPSFADGRGFSLARALRDLGYSGHLRASGHVIADQFRHALQCGFDDVEIDEDLAARQPESQWLAGPWPSYRDKLGFTAAA